MLDATPDPLDEEHALLAPRRPRWNGADFLHAVRRAGTGGGRRSASLDSGDWTVRCCLSQPGGDGGGCRMGRGARSPSVAAGLALSGARVDGLRLLVRQLFRPRDRMAWRLVPPRTRRTHGAGTAQRGDHRSYPGRNRSGYTRGRRRPLLVKYPTRARKLIAQDDGGRRSAARGKLAGRASNARGESHFPTN